MNANTMRSKHSITGLSPKGSNPCGLRCTIEATIQPASVAISTMHSTYATRWMPDGKSIFAISSPPVIIGKPGMTNSIAPIYAVSCCKATGSNKPIRRSIPVQASAATLTHMKVTKNWLRWWTNIRRRSQWPSPAPTKAPIMSYGPPPSRNTKAAHAHAEARPANAGEYKGLRCSIMSSRSCACRTVTSRRCSGRWPTWSK